MKRLAAIMLFCLPAFSYAETPVSNKPIYYGPGLCASPQYECIKVAPGQSWEKLFPDEQQRDLVSAY